MLSNIPVGQKCYAANRRDSTCMTMRVDSDFVICKVNVCSNLLTIYMLR